jgi:ABC-type multidrug transport system ATPase subunit
MPQESLSLNNLTVDEALYFTAHLRGLTRADARRERDALVDLWQLGPLRSQPSPRLSGGEKRLLRLAVAMAGAPPVLILDEPTNDLDPQRRRLVWDNLLQLNRARGTTIIFITHDAIEAEKVIQRVGIMRGGELAAVGRPSDLKQQVDRKLRLELIFPAERPPILPPAVTCQRREAGHWLVLLERSQMAATLDALDLSQIDDFRLYSATLEDLYIYYAIQT